MAAHNKLKLVIEVQADKANASIKGVNQGLAGIERIAVSVAKNASTGIDGMTASAAITARSIAWRRRSSPTPSSCFGVPWTCGRRCRWVFESV